MTDENEDLDLVAEMNEFGLNPEILQQVCVSAQYHHFM